MSRRSVSVLGLAVLSAVAAAPATRPMAASTPGTGPATVAALVDAVDAAYSGLTRAAFDGTIVGHFDVAGRVEDHVVPFTSSFAAPNQFRHEAKGDVVLGCTGTVAYAILPGREEYQSTDAPKGRAASDEWPANVTNILRQQNPSLLLAISKSPRGEMALWSKPVVRLADTTVNGVACPTLKFARPAEGPGIEMAFDPTTSLLRQARLDFKAELEKTGKTDVVAASVVVTYDRIETRPAPVADAFAWTPPAGAVVVSAAQDVAQAGDDAPDAYKDLIGKPAPDFSLKGLKGETVRLSTLKGGVVVLDFWATWCGPCVESLPHLDALFKEQEANGLKVFAVNLEEDGDTVRPFVEKKKWSLPILLDGDGGVAKKYKASGIPQTVVVGKDGVVKMIFVGSGNEEQIAAAVATEMK